jgi:hypothetical protein
MNELMIFGAGGVIGALIIFAMLLLYVPVTNKKEDGVILGCRQRVYFGGQVTSNMADLARIALLSSDDLQKVLDFLLASLSDEAALQIIRKNAQDAGYGFALAEAAGMAKAADALAVSLEHLKSGAMAKELTVEEDKKSRG